MFSGLIAITGLVVNSPSDGVLWWAVLVGVVA